MCKIQDYIPNGVSLNIPTDLLGSIDKNINDYAKNIFKIVLTLTCAYAFQVFYRENRVLSAVSIVGTTFAGVAYNLWSHCFSNPIEEKQSKIDVKVTDVADCVITHSLDTDMYLLSFLQIEDFSRLARVSKAGNKLTNQIIIWNNVLKTQFKVSEKIMNECFNALHPKKIVEQLYNKLYVTDASQFENFSLENVFHLQICPSTFDVLGLPDFESLVATSFLNNTVNEMKSLRTLLAFCKSYKDFDLAKLPNLKTLGIRSSDDRYSIFKNTDKSSVETVVLDAMIEYDDHIVYYKNDNPWLPRDVQCVENVFFGYPKIKTIYLGNIGKKENEVDYKKCVECFCDIFKKFSKDLSIVSLDDKTITVNAKKDTQKRQDSVVIRFHYPI